MNPESSAALVDVFVLRSLASAEVDGQDLADTQQLESCLELHGVFRQRSYLAVDGKRMLCHFRAPDAESLRTVMRLAHIEYDALWSAKVKDTSRHNMERTS